jgi:phage terminase large subunit-like protein
VIRSLVGRHDVVLARGSTYENRSNLAGAFLDEILDRYEGTRLGRQELHAEILADVEGALWDRDSIDDHRVMSAPDLVRVVVAIDPAASAKASSSETGVVVAGLGTDGHGYILDDRTTRGTPLEWASAAVAGYHLHNADRLVAEANQGGDMVRHTIETVEAGLPLKMVHASRGKRTRAEPVAALYEQGRVHHVGAFIELEDQLCGWVPGVSESPDRLDALVWALTELMVAGSRQAATISPISLTQSNPWKPR